mmetsp:Transcript_12377/g.35623  ORF Transcript_12377/g.35623 Transcript_12377/m.35623 type:complete len:220 (-) Transcript_12377:982-1641(-)
MWLKFVLMQHWCYQEHLDYERFAVRLPTRRSYSRRRNGFQGGFAALTLHPSLVDNLMASATKCSSERTLTPFAKRFYVSQLLQIYSLDYKYPSSMSKCMNGLRRRGAAGRRLVMACRIRCRLHVYRRSPCVPGLTPSHQFGDAAFEKWVECRCHEDATTDDQHQMGSAATSMSESRAPLSDPLCVHAKHGGGNCQEAEESCGAMSGKSVQRQSEPNSKA